MSSLKFVQVLQSAGFEVLSSGVVDIQIELKGAYLIVSSKECKKHNGKTYKVLHFDINQDGNCFCWEENPVFVFFDVLVRFNGKEGNLAVFPLQLCKGEDGLLLQSIDSGCFGVITQQELSRLKGKEI